MERKSSTIRSAPPGDAIYGAEKLWTERVVLLQSPLWILPVALVMVTGVLRKWGDAEYLAFSATVAAPSILLPALLPTRPNRAAPWLQSYWFKLNVWVAVLVFFGTYFGSHYFFDLMGMRYAFAVRWNFSSDVVGRDRQQVPVFMYPLTHAYFMTYFAFLTTADREIVRRLRPGPVGRAVVVIALSYSVAFAETFFMASPLLSGLFAYESRHRMLTMGSFGYATYFIAGLPMIRRIDSNGESWTLGRVVIEALATCMALLLLLEIWAKAVGPL